MNASLNQTLTQLAGQQSEVLKAVRQQDGQDHKKQKGGQQICRERGGR